MTEHPSAAEVSTVRLDARSLRGLAHPLRVRLLGLLRELGPSTATLLAAAVGESSGVTSYHLRQLAEHGLVVEDETPRGSRRERWWRAAHRMTVLEPVVGHDPDAAVHVDAYVRTIATSYADRLLRFADGRADLARTLGQDWSDAADLSDWLLELTATEALELGRELSEVVGRYRVADPERPAQGDRNRVAVQVQVMPTLSAAAVGP